MINVIMTATLVIYEDDEENWCPSPLEKNDSHASKAATVQICNCTKSNILPHSMALL